MPILIPTYLAFVLILFRKTKGPVWALAIGWLISTIPLTVGLLSYTRFQDLGFEFEATVIAYLGCFVLGAFFVRAACAPHGIVKPVPINEVESVELLLPTVRFCWWIAMIGVLFSYVDFYASGRANADDIIEIRSLVTSTTQATIWGQLSSVMLWGAFYCFCFSLMYWEKLDWRQIVRFALPILCLMAIMIMSAGRQIAFQIVMLTVLVAFIRRLRSGDGSFLPKGSGIFVAIIVVLMAAYVSYVTVARSDTSVALDRTVILNRLFDFVPSKGLEAFEEHLSIEARGVLNEMLIYFTHVIVFFKAFLTVPIAEHNFGAMEFPFVMRQLEPVTGISVIGTLRDKQVLMSATGVMATGWTTAISGYILDFGYVGAGVYMFLLGYYSEYAWERARTDGGFGDILIAAILLLNALNSPLSAMTGDTNMFLLWAFCIFLKLLAKYPPPALDPAKHKWIGQSTA